MEIYQIFGPPGCGKTTALATKYIPAAVKKYGGDKVMIVSFTRAAAREIAFKKDYRTGEIIDLGIPDKNVGTLHQICFHALGQPKIIETDPKLMHGFGDKYGTMSFTGRSISAHGLDNANETDDFSIGQPTDGDHLLNALNIQRNKLIPKGKWHHRLVKFSERWSAYKEETGSVDFTDLIDKALSEVPYAPGQPSILFADEAQDFTQLQLKLCKSWALQMKWLVLVGDDEQCIYSFSGASPQAFLDDSVKEENKTVLDQSYRVPEEVRLRALKLISKCTLRYPKHYKSRVDEDGNVVQGIVKESVATWKSPEYLIQPIQRAIEAGNSVMVLASCSYMLDPMRATLMSYGIPFANRYRRKNPKWNPLYVNPDMVGVRALEIIRNFFAQSKEDPPHWTIEQFITWAKFIKVCQTGLQRKRAKEALGVLEAAVKNEEPGLHTTREVLSQILTEDAIRPALARDKHWLLDNIKKARRDGMMYPLRVFDRHGMPALHKEPLVTLGTIHSVKGGEAHTVYLFPDLSSKANDEAQKSTEHMDTLYRLFYVGMTRAAYELTICDCVVKDKSDRDPNWMGIDL